MSCQVMVRLQSPFLKLAGLNGGLQTQSAGHALHTCRPHTLAMHAGNALQECSAAQLACCLLSAGVVDGRHVLTSGLQCHTV